MPRQRLYSSNAERQAAYRGRVALRTEALATQGAVERIKQLEAELARAERRAIRAEAGAKAADAQAAMLAKRLATLGPPRPGPLGASADVESLRRRINSLEALVVELEEELEEAHRVQRAGDRPAASAGSTLNRAARRAAERQHQRRRQ